MDQTTEPNPAGAQRRADCAIDGCDKEKRPRGQYCGMHAARISRHGDPNFSKHDESSRFFHPSGYVQITRSKHPLREFTKTGRLWEHRVALFDVIGHGGHACHWCGNIVAWGDRGTRMLVVDHLDSNRRNNDPDNLVASCAGCNTRRGSRHSRAATTRGAV